MDWILDRSIKAGDLPISIPQPLPFRPSLPPPSPPRSPTTPPPSAVNNFADKISPNVLFIFVILAVILFVAGLVNLLVRCLPRPRRRRPGHDVDSATALQGQLQQLFILHDAGVGQSFIDTLPMFLYKAIVGLKDPFDCAVCLCEFEADDKLRLLPSCSHAFHVQCIDTWLLSHSTCPLCRTSLILDLSPANNRSPVSLVLESASQSSRALVMGGDDRRASANDASGKTAEVAAKEEAMVALVSEASDAINVVPVKLGKFRRVHSKEDDQGNINVDCSGHRLDHRRCFSMGAYEYFMDEGSSLRVVIKPTKKKARTKTKPGHRLTNSECGERHWKSEGLKGFDARRSQEFRIDHVDSTDSTTSNGLQKKESFSISKTWLRAKNSKQNTAVEDYSRRAFSFRLPLYQVSSSDESKLKNTVIAQKIDESEKRGSKIDLDVEVGGTRNKSGVLSRADEETPSFTIRTFASNRK